MGGKDGSRGYLYQALVAVLDAIQNEDWVEVYLEYETDNDKVDIAFKDSNGNLEVIQVKSSINNFSKYDIDKWLIELIEDKSDASKFKLILIGTGESKTKGYVNAINKISDNRDDKTSDKIKPKIPDSILTNINKVNIDMLNDDMDSFEKNIGFTLYKFLDIHGYTVPSKIIDLIVGGVTYQFNKLCTSGDFVSREDFIEHILEWASYNYDLGTTDNLKKYFEVKYYHDNQFWDKLDSDIRIDIVEKYEEIEKIKLETEEILKDLEEIDSLEKQNQHYCEKIGINKSLLQTINTYSSIQSSAKNVEIPLESKQYITEYFETVGKKFNSDFFNLGNLKIESGLYKFEASEKLMGSDLSKRKYELIKNIELNIEYINKYKDINVYLEYLSSYKILPLSIKNVSRKYVEDITLDIKIPKKLQILNQDNIEIPDEFIIEDIKKILDELLSGIEDSNIKEFSSKFIPYDQFNYMKSKVDRFIEFIEDMFEYKIFNNEKEYTILQCKFKGLNPHDAMYLPMSLMIKSEDEFEIEYSIKCKNMSKIETGKIKA